LRFDDLDPVDTEDELRQLVVAVDPLPLLSAASASLKLIASTVC
jgi:hypothetical protein